MEKRIVQLTGFREEEKESLVKLLHTLPCVFLDSEKFELCTHLIAKKPSRSEKWLAACASGKWVLTKEYVINSAESGRWLDETTYEWGYKMERDAHYSPQMQSAPKRWREHLTHTGALGAFSRWKVALLIQDADKEREAFLRVLAAGQATLQNAEHPDGGITHVFTNNKSLLIDKEKRIHSAPYYSVLYLGAYLLEDPIENILIEMTEEGRAELEMSIWKHICMTQACRQKSTAKFTGYYEKLKAKGNDIGRASLNRLEELIDGQFITEAFGEIEHLLPSVFPEKFFMSLFNHFIQGNVDISHFGRFFGAFSNLLFYHPPWESVHMSQFYLNILQCPVCKKGTWSFIETLIRCFFNNFCLCHETSDLAMDSNKRRKIAATVLKFVTNVMQEEVKFLTMKLLENRESQKTLFPSFIVGLFWSETRTMMFFTKNLNVLTDLVIMLSKKTHHCDSVLSQEVAMHLNELLAAVADYWILLGFYLNKNLLHQVASDFAYHVSVLCEEFTPEAKEHLVSSLASSWLQMVIAEVIFRKHFLEYNIPKSSGLLTLEKLIHTYIPALWQRGARGSEKVQKLQGKRKIGQRPCLESQRALLMLNGENQSQGDVLLDLPHVPKLRRMTQGSSKQALPNVYQPQFQCQDKKGETVLHRVCRINNIKKLSLHLSLPGVDINVKDNAGWTPLHEACNHGSTECVREILQRCPEVDLLSHVDGVTPLHDALQNGHIEIGKMLLQHGGPRLLQQKDDDGNFPLDYISSSQVKHEVFEIIQVKETIDEFHRDAALASEGHKLEFGAFLLTRMLISFISIYGLHTEQGTAKTHCPNAAFLATCAKRTPSFRNSILECYVEAMDTVQHLSDFGRSIPESFLQNSKFNVQVLLTLLHTMTSSISVPSREWYN
ncbi:SMC5-SMC6 complex localization factor protein 1 [Hyperolius riggenbachi]|uniref:SMC5-SMC6 complex localization factor protein 1 n=1 Tax=Hyperolius riggenbachi TaxID=752182 RepID=UPI0035A345E1